MKRVVLCAILVLGCLGAGAQKVSLSTNVLGYVNMLTLNLEGSVAVAQHWSLAASARYNPFHFKKSDGAPISSRQQAYSLGMRYWPWYVYSGWWIGGKVQYQEYNWGGLTSEKTEEGDRFGAGVSAGYTYMLAPHVNLDFGLGLWGGYDKYKRYSCPVCGLTEASGDRFFILPNDVTVALSFVF